MLLVLVLKCGVEKTRQSVSVFFSFCLATLTTLIPTAHCSYHLTFPSSSTPIHFNTLQLDPISYTLVSPILLPINFLHMKMYYARHNVSNWDSLSNLMLPGQDGAPISTWFISEVLTHLVETRDDSP